MLIAFDLTNVQSLVQTDEYLREVLDARNPADGGCPIVLVGTKVDDASRRQVRTEDAAEFARQRGLHYCETSAKQGLHAVQCPFFLAVSALSRTNGWVKMTDKEASTDATETAMLALKQSQWRNS